MEIGLLIGIPFITSLIILILGKRASGFAGVLACLSTATGLAISLLTFDQTLQIEIPWITAAGFQVNLSAQISKTASIMLPLVHGIALLVQGYSIGYMKADPAISRYFGFLQLFLFSMIGILLAGNLIVIYIFWELVGLSSYLLIGFWNRKPRTVWAAQKAFILNRIGDAAFLCGILLLIFGARTVDFDELPAAISQMDNGLLTAVGILLFGGCIGKSAQFPLSGWLPDAMEGPTPVSALIHAATMVAAGIFLMTRIAFLLTPQAEVFIAVTGLITMADGAIRACYAWDIKRVLAYSTQSQLGLMVFAVGLGAWEVAFFHLVTHAFFKAGLFLSAGSVIHAVTPTNKEAGAFDPQDMRTMGGLKSKLPVTYICYLLCTAALAGLPFFSGFLSKDAIFLEVLEKTDTWGAMTYIALGIAMLSAGLTAYYMTRQVWLIFYGLPRYGKSLVDPHESGPVMWIPMVVLAFLSLFFIFSLNPVDASSGWLLSTLGYESQHHSLLIPAFSVAISVSAILIALKKANSPAGFLAEKRNPFSSFPVQPLRDYREEKRFTTFFLAPFQHFSVLLRHIEAYVVDGMVNLAGILAVETSKIAGWSDRRIVDGIVKLVARTATSAGSAVRSVQNGKIQSYYLATFISFILLVIWLLAGN